jgi:hypothetical protein
MREAISGRKKGILTYGITPPKASYSVEKRSELAAKQAQRIRQLAVDALVVYDLQDESSRTALERPYPFLHCVDSTEYAIHDLAELQLPKVVYQCVASKPATDLLRSLEVVNAAGGLGVLVGAASREQPSVTRLSEAQAKTRSALPDLPLGGVLIAERHEARGGEDLRALSKVTAGCSFFISQAVYAVTASKNLLSDLSYRCEDDQRAVPPILITLSPCGSVKTLEFMQWLGISVPSWLHNELRHSKDILQTSVDVCVDTFADLWDFAQRRNVPLGCNVESVSLNKSEVDASVELVHRIAKVMGRQVNIDG